MGKLWDGVRLTTKGLSHDSPEGKDPAIFLYGGI